VFYDRWYSTQEDINTRLQFARTDSPVEREGADDVDDDGIPFKTLNILSMFVFPQRSSQQPAFVVLSTVRDMGATADLFKEHASAMCGTLDMREFSKSPDNMTPVSLRRCGVMVEFFNLGTESGYVPVLFTPPYESSDEQFITVAQVPTLEGSPLKVVKYKLVDGGTIEAVLEDTVSVIAQDIQIKNTFPAFQQISSYGRATLMSVRNFLPEHLVATTDGLLVTYPNTCSKNRSKSYQLTSVGSDRR
jgi:hypothetical protein